MTRLTRVAVVLLVLAAASPPAIATAQELASARRHDRQTSVLDRAANIDVRHVTLAAALTQLVESSGVPVAYSPSLALGVGDVSCSCRNVSVRVALERLLAGTDFAFSEQRGQVVIFLNHPSAREEPATSKGVPLVSPVDMSTTTELTPSETPARAEPGAISGTVVQAANQRPIRGAQVSIPATGRGANTDAEGRFRIGGLTGDTVTVRVTMLGYKPVSQTLKVGTEDARFALEETAVGLEAVVVTASGAQRLREVGSAIERVQADSAAKTAPATDLAELLDARASGVYVKTASGSSAGGSRIRIRGSSSPSLPNEPIVYVDGVRVNTDPQSLSWAANQQMPSRFNDLNPDDIASIDILKGPAASTMYGSEAADGVILITTKSGSAASGRSEWRTWFEEGRITDPNDYPANYQAVTSAGKACLLTAQASGTCTQSTLNTFNLLRDPSTSPLKTGNRGVAGVSMSGKLPQMDYFLSGEYSDEQGVYRPVDGARKTSTRANFTVHPSNILSVDANAGYISNDLLLFADGGTALGIVTNALAGGACNTCWFQLSPKQLDQINAKQHVDRFTGSTTGHLQPVSWFQLRGTVGLDATGILDQRLFPVGIFPGSRANGELDVGRNTTVRNTADLLGRFDFALTPAINSTTSIGAQYTRDLIYIMTATGFQLVPGSNSLADAGTITTLQQTTQVKNVGEYLEQQFGFHDRLFLTGGLRNDNNSSFGQHFKAIVYPKLSASWVISEEPFFPSQSAVSSLRLRTAWGESGSQPGPLNAVTYYNSFPVTTPDGTNQVGVSFQGGNLGNPNLKPERSTETELGFDAGLVHDRVNFSVTYYNKLTHDGLVLRTLAPSVGTSTGQWVNLSEIQNKGLETSLTSALYQSRPLRFDLTVRGTWNANKLLALGQGIAPIATGTNQRHVQGYPLGGYWMRTVSSFSDADHNGIISGNEVSVTDTAVYLGQTTPPFIGSVEPTVTFFDALRVSALVALSYGNKLYNFTEGFRCNLGDARARNDVTTPLAQQAACVAHSLLGAPGGMVYDDGFTKLRELDFTWQVPNAWAHAARVQSANFTVAGQNLGVWTKYPGIDPDVSSRGTNFETVDFLQPGSRRVWIVRANLVP